MDKRGSLIGRGVGLAWITRVIEEPRRISPLARGGGVHAAWPTPLHHTTLPHTHTQTRQAPPAPLHFNNPKPLEQGTYATALDSTRQYSKALDNIRQHSAALDSTRQHPTAFDSTSPRKDSTAFDSTRAHSTVLDSTRQPERLYT